MQKRGTWCFNLRLRSLEKTQKTPISRQCGAKEIPGEGDEFVCRGAKIRGKKRAWSHRGGGLGVNRFRLLP